MLIDSKKKLKNIVTILSVTMFFACINDTNEVRDFLAMKNLPIGTARNVFHVYKDSGRITSKLTTPILLDFSNRKEHPYNEFPKGIKLVKIPKNGIDSVTVISDYCLSYTTTQITELKGNVKVYNHHQNSKLETSQLYWDQKTGYFISEKAFTLFTLKDTIRGVGFESKENLSKWSSKNITGTLETSEE